MQECGSLLQLEDCVHSLGSLNLDTWPFNFLKLIVVECDKQLTKSEVRGFAT